MITITVINSKFKFKYRGNVELQLVEPFLLVTADEIVRDKDTITAGPLTFDKFWITDIETITGK